MNLRSYLKIIHLDGLIFSAIIITILLSLKLVADWNDFELPKYDPAQQKQMSIDRVEKKLSVITPDIIIGLPVAESDRYTWLQVTENNTESRTLYGYSPFDTKQEQKRSLTYNHILQLPFVEQVIRIVKSETAENILSEADTALRESR